MGSTNPADLAKNHGILGYLHYLIFPLDVITANDPKWQAGREQRITELTPIMIWLIPLIIVLSGLLSINIAGMILLFAVEIVLLLLLSMIYCWRGSLRFIFETGINYTLSFLIFGITVFLIMMIILPFGFFGAIIGIIILFSIFGRNRDGYYSSTGDFFDNDDDW